MLDMNLFRWSILIGLGYAVNNVLGFRGALIVSHGWGYDDLNQIKNSALIKNLPDSIADFTVAAADTNPSCLGFLTGNLQLNPDTDKNMPLVNMHTVFNSANITTAHFGAWNFAVLPAVKNYQISNDPVETINAALQFINSYNKNQEQYLITVFLPYVDVAFLSAKKTLQNFAGVGVGSVNCKDVLRRSSNPTRYKFCPKQIHQASKTYEDRLLGKLTAALNKQRTFTIWSAAHGGVNPHIHSNSAPRSSLRGEQGSLYDGGIRTRLRYNAGGNKKFAVDSANAIDILPSFINLANLPPIKTAGINLFAPGIERTVQLEWANNKTPAGHCSNAAPAKAVQIHYSGNKYKLLYDAKRTEIYAWNSGYELEQAKITLAIPPRPLNTVPGCTVMPATGIKRSAAINPRPRGIINIITDDMGYGDYSFTSNHPTGNNYPYTPNIDMLAKTGLIFTQFHTAGTSCSPTRASILTARFPFHVDIAVHTSFDDTGAYNPNDGLPPFLGYKKNITYVNTFFQAKGWITGHFGKWHQSFQGQNTPAAYGLDNYRCYTCDAPVKNRYNNGDLYFPAHASSYIIADAINWISTQIATNKKFYLTLALQNAHSPINTERGQAAELGFPDSSNPYLTVGESKLSDNERPLQTYAALVKEQDNQIGNLINFLKTKNLFDDTIIMWSTDNGPEYTNVYFNSVGSNGPHRGGKRSVYEGGTHVPLIIKWGDKFSGTTDILTSSVDIYPTAVGLAGYAISDAFDAARFDGIDLAPCIMKNQCDHVRSRTLLWEQRGDILGADCLGISPRYGIKRGKYKLYLESKNKQGPKQDTFTRTELYDVINDPFESQNLAVSEPALVKEYTEILRAYKYYDNGNWFPALTGHSQTPQSKKMYVGERCT